MNGNLAVLLMGSKVDLEHAKKITAWLDHFGIAHETRIASAHKTPEKVLEILADNEKRGLDIVYIDSTGAVAFIDSEQVTIEGIEYLRFENNNLPAIYGFVG